MNIDDDLAATKDLMALRTYYNLVNLPLKDGLKNPLRTEKRALTELHL